MKKSLEILGVSSSGLKDNLFFTKKEELLLTANDDIKTSLAKILEALKNNPINPKPYIEFSKIALKNNAIKLAKELCKIGLWLSYKQYESYLNEVNDLANEINQKEQSNKDESDSKFWKSLFPNFQTVIKACYYRLYKDDFNEYSLRLLELYPKSFTYYYAILRLLAEKELDNSKIIALINSSNQLSKTDKTLLTGIDFHYKKKINESITQLNQILKEDEHNTYALSYQCLNYIFENKYDLFKQNFLKINPQNEPLIIVLYIFNELLSKNPQMDLSTFNQHEVLLCLKKICKNIISYKPDSFESLIPKLCELKHFSPYLCELFLENNETHKAKELIHKISHPEKLRLEAWLLRLEGKESDAENLLLKYREAIDLKKGEGFFPEPTSLNLQNKKISSINDIIPTLTDIYSNTTKLTNELQKNYGLDFSTCQEAKCQDCCTYTYPYISYIEFMYMKHFTNEGKNLFSEDIKEYCIKIREDFKQKINLDIPFLKTDIPEEEKFTIPLDFHFKCPFLGDNKCNLYEGRPFTCRAYGFGSGKESKYKGCKYFLEQFTSSTNIHYLRKTIDMREFYKFAESSDKSLINKSIIAPIPIWFSYNDEELTKILESL